MAHTNSSGDILSAEGLTYLYHVFQSVEMETLINHPDYEGGFKTLELQVERLNKTINSVQEAHALIITKKTNLETDLQAWRDSNPTQQIRGIRQDRNFYRKLARSGKPKPARVFTRDLDTEAAKAKNDFERHDFELRNRIEGLKLLKGMLEEAETKLQRRVVGCKDLLEIGEKLDKMEIKDKGELAKLKERMEVVEGANYIEEVEEMLKMLEEQLR